MVGAIFIKIKMYDKDKNPKHILNCSVIAISYLNATEKKWSSLIIL
jgi:hypothetical protein